MTTQSMHPNHLLQSWLTPRSTNRDEAFRERVIRGTLAIIILLGLISFMMSVLVFRSAWGWISFPTLHVVALTGFVLTGIAVWREHLLGAGLLMVLSLVLGASLLVLLARQQQEVSTIVVGLAAFMFVPLVTTLVLPRTYIIPFSALAAIIYLLAEFVVPVGTLDIPGFTLEQFAIPALALLLIEGALLRLFRVEFDARLNTLRESIAEAELARMQADEARQEAEAADRAKTQFLANMSHELRTPLNAIIGYDEAMLGGMVGTFTADQSKLLRHIQHNSRRLLSLINDVLDLSKIESGSVEVYLAPISPRRIIEQTLESLQSLAAEKDIELAAQFDESMPGVILGDPKKIQQVLVNLVGNAIKFTDKGSVTVEVSLLDQERWQFRVRDTGIGIAEDEIANVFEPFRQVDNSATRKYKGTGLGLSITKRLVEILKGEITLESKLNHGSTFIVTLPRVNAPIEVENVELNPV